MKWWIQQICKYFEIFSQKKVGLESFFFTSETIEKKCISTRCRKKSLRRTSVSFNESKNKYYSVEDLNTRNPKNGNGVILNINKLEGIPYIDEIPNSIYIKQSSENISLQDSNDQIVSEIKNDGTINKGFVSEENNEETISLMCL